MNLSTNPLFIHSIDELCTICHVILKDTYRTHSIFSTLEELESPMNLLEVLQTFSNFRFYNGPQTVCTTCYGKTIEVYKFIQMCNKASENIQHYLKNLEAIKTIKEETDVDVKVEEISIGPTRIIIVDREFLEEKENEKISKIDELEMEKKETSNNGEVIISYTEIVTEEKTNSDFDNLMVFSDKKELGDHRTKELCNSLVGTKYNLRTHDQRHNSQRAHISKDLDLKQDRHQPLKDHETDVVCLEGQEVINNDKQLEIHMRRNHKKKFLCNDCGKVFTTKKLLNAHIHVHAGENLVTCLICNRRFTMAANLRSHMDSHSGVKPHKCEQCDRRFTTAGNLRRHKDSHNGVKPHKCEQCDRRFTTAGNLRSHMNLYNGVKPHKCEQCDQRFTQASHLRTHLAVHNGVKAHKCEQCDRRFTQAGTLRSHMNIHSGVKVFKCEQSDRGFSQAANLLTYMDSHNAVQVHKCEQCDRGFTHASALRGHMGIHNGVKPYKCEQCDQRFAHVVHLRRHMDIHNRVKAQM